MSAFDLSTLDRCADQLAEVLNARIAGTAEGRWDALLEHVAALRDHPPLLVRGAEDEAVDRRKCALGMSIEARSRNGHAETSDETVARAKAFEQFLNAESARG